MANDGRYLKPSKLVETLDRLNQRIIERFPGSGLSRVCADLLSTAKLTDGRARNANRPNRLVYLFVAVVLAGFVVGQVYALSLLDMKGLSLSGNVAELTSALESAVNLMLLAGALVWFLVTLDTRLKRRKAFRHLHELRCIAHMIDIHQLTKDPVVILHDAELTTSSPKREMTGFQLARYLDYCSEMLSLVGKLAALYAERTHDSQTVAAATDIETLTTNLSRKIWQKIMFIGNRNDHRPIKGKA
jgi:hypothetical protein